MSDTKKQLRGIIDNSLKKAQASDLVAAKIVLDLPDTENTDELRHFVVTQLYSTRNPGVEAVVTSFDNFFETGIKRLRKANQSSQENQ